MEEGEGGSTGSTRLGRGTESVGDGAGMDVIFISLLPATRWPAVSWSEWRVERGERGERREERGGGEEMGCGLHDQQTVNLFFFHPFPHSSSSLILSLSLSPGTLLASHISPV